MHRRKRCFLAGTCVLLVLASACGAAGSSDAVVTTYSSSPSSTVTDDARGDADAAEDVAPGWRVPRCNSVDDCLAQMTLDEKIGQMTQVSHLALQTPNVVTNYAIGSLLAGGGGAPLTGNTPEDWANMVDEYQAAALDSRLGIPMIFGVDAVHGHSNVTGATIFPHNIGLGATRNPDLVRRVGEVTAKEVYATGIPWNFAPCLCVARDERWGRTYESYGEDPSLVSLMTSYIDGLQGDDLSAPNTVLATAKHWVGDGGTTGGIDQGDTAVSEDVLTEIHIEPFVDAVARDVGSVMPSYSSWNGEKLHGHDYLLTDVLRGDVGFDGFVISDWAAIDQLPGDYASDVRESINAGVDMVMVPDDYERFISTLRAEVDAGNVSMMRIDEAVGRILTAKFELGLFDRPMSDRTHIDEVGSQEHREVARQAVRESLVLLKDNGILPLSATVDEVLLAGFSADDIGNQSGGWTITWQGASGATTTGTSVRDALEDSVGADTTVTFNRRATGELSADIGIVVVGETPYAEGRGDSFDLSLSARDVGIVERVCDAMPCVVILISGRPMLINDVLEASDAFIAAWLPGTEGGGVADVLFGDYDFVGRLPMSWPRSMAQIPINVGDAEYDPLFPYGFGLSVGGS